MFSITIYLRTAGKNYIEIPSNPVWEVLSQKHIQMLARMQKHRQTLAL